MSSNAEGVAALASKFTYAGSGAALFFGLSANEVAAFGGLLIGLVGLIVQIYYKRKEDRRKVAQHARFLDSMTLPRDMEE